MKQPSFFLVGAPKCGTTALCKYLNQHPEIFISQPKELYYFDADFKTKKYANSLDEYLAKFAAGDGKICGEGSTTYLYSKVAAKNIYRFNPEAKIIVMLRNPLTVMHSFHSQLLFNGSSETVQDFAIAIELEAERKLGHHIPKRCQTPELLLYREVVRFAEQIERYFTVFGKEQVKIVIFDDFQAETATVYREILEFVGADSTFETSFVRINANKKARSSVLQSLLKYPPAKLLQLGKYLLPVPQSWRRRALEQAKARLTQLNTQTVSRSPIDRQLRQRLVKDLQLDIQKLECLLGRDLSAWYSEEGATTSDLESDIHHGA
ncbi:MAG: sulfotransferase [Phormidesmis sp.]